ncbi:hypothetical protein G3I15_53860, partial [Streptomyces sp. SID10244]|nr:hypothetical protein [Streptomyces sp. SID10244]
MIERARTRAHRGRGGMGASELAERIGEEHAADVAACSRGRQELLVDLSIGEQRDVAHRAVVPIGDRP